MVLLDSYPEKRIKKIIHVLLEQNLTLYRAGKLKSNEDKSNNSFLKSCYLSTIIPLDTDIGDKLYPLHQVC